jgi:serum/glucocorticoid-regulated kinase 2
VFAVVEKQTGKVFAMKAISKDLLLDQNCIESTLLEKEILLENHHPFLINMSYVFQTQMKIYFVMRFARGGDL